MQANRGKKSAIQLQWKMYRSGVKFQMELDVFWKDSYVLSLICMTYVDVDFVCFPAIAGCV